MSYVGILYRARISYKMLEVKILYNCRKTLRRRPEAWPRHGTRPVRE